MTYRLRGLNVLSASRDEAIGERVPVERIGLSQIRGHAVSLRDLAGGPIEHEALVRHIARRLGYGRTSAALRDKIELALRTEGPANGSSLSGDNRERILHAARETLREAFPPRSKAPSPLAKAEQRVLKMLAAHETHREITRRLALEASASRKIQAKLARLLGVDNKRNEIVAAARKRGWV